MQDAYKSDLPAQQSTLIMLGHETDRTQLTQSVRSVTIRQCKATQRTS
jgi:hypothetical protein